MSTYPISPLRAILEKQPKLFGINGATISFKTTACHFCKRTRLPKNVNWIRAHRPIPNAHSNDFQEIYKDYSLFENDNISSADVPWSYPAEKRDLVVRLAETHASICTDCAKEHLLASEIPIICKRCNAAFPAFRGEHLDAYCSGIVTRWGVNSGGCNQENEDWCCCNPMWMEVDANEKAVIPDQLQAGDCICDECILDLYFRGHLDAGIDGELARFVEKTGKRGRKDVGTQTEETPLS
ncbi:hypothetical protein HK104_009715, partial [Borealophlyctis nickersoniae]